MRTIALVLSLCALLAGCADLKQDLRELRDYLRTLRGKDPAPPPPQPPIATTPAPGGLSLNGNCVGKEETGYAENVRVVVANGQVSALEARIDIPKRGNCRFMLSEFHQAMRTPYVELQARSAPACMLRMWQQDDRVTLAASDCEDKCSRGAFEYLWPVEFKSPGGGCY